MYFSTLQVHYLDFTVNKSVYMVFRSLEILKLQRMLLSKLLHG